MATQSIRVSTKILGKVKRYTEKTKQSIGGFYDLAAEEKLAREKISAKIKQQSPLLNSGEQEAYLEGRY